MLLTSTEDYLTFPCLIYADEILNTVQHRLTKVKTMRVASAGVIDFEPKGKAGELHQFSVMSAGCSTSIIFFDGQRTMFRFPVLQTGSFKLEAAFNDGLRLWICSAADAPPDITVNWRVVK